jgi:hypothetical protein
MGLSCNFSLKPIQWETTASPGPELVVSKDHLRAGTAMRIQDQGFRMRKAGLVNPIPVANISSIVRCVYPGLSSGEGGGEGS